MALTLAASGSQACTVGATVHTLAALEAVGVYQLGIDIATIVANDVLIVKINKALLTGGTVRLVQSMTFYGVDPLSDFIKISVPVTHDLTDTDLLTFTLQQSFGTSRTIPWSVWKHG